MNLVHVMAEMLPAVELELQAAVDGAMRPEYRPVRDMMAYAMGWEGEGSGEGARGKRIRPLLVLLSTEAAGGNWRNALPAAAAVELIHNFSLIHDDIEDESTLRRGRPTVWVKWGRAQAINAGDAMFAAAHLTALRLADTIGVSAGLAAAELLQQTCLLLTGGQYLDMAYEQRSDLTVDDYWPMVGGKTAALLACCTQLGALSAHADAVCQKHFYQFGWSLGLAFQAFDDILGIWGDAQETGKSIESDLVSGKKSLPVLYGLSQNGKFARRWRQGAVAPADVAALAEMLKQEGGLEFTRQTAENYTRLALRELENCVVNEAMGALLRELADRLLARTK